MKFRESGMPAEDMWATFFCPETVIKRLEVPIEAKLIVDVGCGYGTFLIPTAQKIAGDIIGVDVDQSMLDYCNQKAKALELKNVKLMQRDVLGQGYCETLEEVDGVFLFNILHCEEPENLLKNTYKLLQDKGRLYVIHWNYDELTPRGPSMDIRPKPEQIVEWATRVGFCKAKQVKVGDYHYGLVFTK